MLQEVLKTSGSSQAISSTSEPHGTRATKSLHPTGYAPSGGSLPCQPELQNPQGLCDAHQANPCFAAAPFSLELSQVSAKSKTPHKLSSETMVTQSLGATSRMLIL